MNAFGCGARGLAGERAFRFRPEAIMFAVMADDAPSSTLQKRASVEAVASAKLSDPRQWVELHGNYLF
jgi:hypothetical protein